MELSLETFAEVIGCLGGKIEARGGDDKRRASRVPMQFRCQITPAGDADNRRTREARIRDFSPRGVCIECAAAIERGQQFVLHLPGRGGTRARLLCTVVHLKEAGEGAFTIGAEFTCVLRPDDAIRPSTRDVDRIRDSMFS